MYMKDDKKMYKVVATNKKTKKLVAEYLFDSAKEALKFHSAMVGKGLHSELTRI